MRAVLELSDCVGEHGAALVDLLGEGGELGGEALDLLALGGGLRPELGSRCLCRLRTVAKLLELDARVGDLLKDGVSLQEEA